ncbi:hypothetical protein [Prescottella subtropica]|uniref:hypothetical protein n=1 Tax=Prescottella subtropica TaxID=2545757 RepID=UPI0010F76CD4|nr:hypothetical protein [Prescottella subtropica]
MNEQSNRAGRPLSWREYRQLVAAAAADWMRGLPAAVRGGGQRFRRHRGFRMVVLAVVVGFVPVWNYPSPALQQASHVVAIAAGGWLALMVLSIGFGSARRRARGRNRR